MDDKHINSLLERAATAKRKLAELQTEYDEAIEPLKDLVVSDPTASINGFGIAVSYVKPSESLSIDLKKLKESEPELYEDLVRDYPKKTVRNASARVSFYG